MSEIRKRAGVAKWHRRLGILLTVPLLFWIVSAFLLHYYGLVMPNGLQGVYRLAPYNSQDVDLREARISPDSLLSVLNRDYQLDSIYWLKLQSRGPHLWYVVQPTPFALGMVFDARTGARLDPLPDSLLEVVANEALTGTHAGEMSQLAEYHRDYDVAKVPAVKFVMQGEQPTELVLARHTGRTLRRSDSQARQFNWWYRTLHVFQWGDNMALFTTFLYVLAALGVVLAFFGLRLWWWRRGRPKAFYDRPNMKVRLWHRRLGLTIGVLLLAQMVLGAYMWLSLGPLQDPFRGKNTFNRDWNTGLATSTSLPDVAEFLERLESDGNGQARPIQALQWRMRGDRVVCVVNHRNDEVGQVYDVVTAERLDDLTPQEAGHAARLLMRALPDFEFRGETTYYFNDLNRKIPAYHFRFADDTATDVFVCKRTGEIISRRTRFWRAFGPILTLHAYAFTDNSVLDTLFLSVFQIGLLGLLLTGWRLNFQTRKSPNQAGS